MKLRCKKGGRYKLRDLKTDQTLALTGSDVNVLAVRLLMAPYKFYGPDEFSVVGAVPKEILERPSGRQLGLAYIAKHPHKEGSLECVTEYLIGKIGQMLPLSVAKVDLVRVGPRDADIRFLSRYFLNVQEEQLLQRIVRCRGMLRCGRKAVVQGSSSWQTS